jgi:tetratricopeptide (TPR) repeat protein
MQDDFGSAVKACDHALEFIGEEGDDELKPFIIAMRGIAKAGANDSKGAIQDLTDAIEIRPDYLGLYYYRARVFINDDQYKSGIEDLSYLIDQSPACFGAYYFRGVAYQESNDYAAAIRDFKAYLTKTGGTASTTNVLPVPADAIDDARQRLRDLGAPPD